MFSVKGPDFAFPDLMASVLGNGRSGGCLTMDTKTLVVGQEIRIFFGHYTCDAKVVKVTPEGAIVDAGDGLLRFNNLGKGYYIRSPFEIECPRSLVHRRC
jgi:hypothetical protein